MATLKMKPVADSTDPAQITFGTENSRGPAHARSSDPATSKQAAATLTLANMRASQMRVLKLFADYGDMDDRALLRVAEAEGVKMSPSGLRSRRSELAKPNMERLDEIAQRIYGRAFAGLEFAGASDCRVHLRHEGFRSPLWDTGKRVTYEGGREGIVWGRAV